MVNIIGHRGPGNNDTFAILMNALHMNEGKGAFDIQIAFRLHILQANPLYALLDIAVGD